MLQNLDFIASHKVSGLMDELRDIRELPGTLRFLNRTPLVPATDGEIVGYITDDVIIADVVANDAAARTYGGEKIRLEITELPNIKIGHQVSQERINLLIRLAHNALMRGEGSDLSDWRLRQIDKLLLGCRQRQEQMIIGAITDSWTYDRNGVKASISFSTPSDLKVTVSTAWSNTSTATPIADIQSQQALGREKYGVNYDRLTMNSATFRELIATDEFRNKAALYSQLVLPSASTFPVEDMAMMQSLLGRLVGAEIELYDEQYTTEGTDGALSRSKFVADGKVILSSRALDNSENVLDFGDAIVTESIIGGGDGVLGTIPAMSRGPIAYTTVPSGLNPPNLTLWGVARGFPRKKLKSAFSVLTV